MSQYYNPKRTKNLFNPESKDQFKLSRSKIDLFLNCPRCFYLDRRLGVDRPPKYGVDAMPVAHKDLDQWRANFIGVQYLHKPTNFIVTGAIDDVWINSNGELMVVDYKATSKESEVNLEAEWQIGYKRQMEIYQWLLRKNGHKVSDIGYFVYCNGKTDRAAFDGKLDFDVTILDYKGDDGWVEKAVKEAHDCLVADSIPKANSDCDYCNYREAVNDLKISR